MKILGSPINWLVVAATVLLRTIAVPLLFGTRRWRPVDQHFHAHRGPVDHETDRTPATIAPQIGRLEGSARAEDVPGRRIGSWPVGQ
jgi:hypothetical protein